MNQTLKHCDDRFEIGQLYRFNNFTFPDSRNQALTRLKIVERKMDEDPEYASQYCQRMNEYFQKCYARILKPEEVIETYNTYYLAHFKVESAGKFRIVMDATAKSNGFSLNDFLL